MKDEEGNQRKEFTPTTLSNLRPGETGRVMAMGPKIRGLARRRLLDLGFLPGTHVTPAFASPAGNPTAYEIKGALIALRLEQTQEIMIEPLVSSATEKE